MVGHTDHGILILHLYIDIFIFAVRIIKMIMINIMLIITVMLIIVVMIIIIAATRIVAGPCYSLKL